MNLPFQNVEQQIEWQAFQLIKEHGLEGAKDWAIGKANYYRKKIINLPAYDAKTVEQFNQDKMYWYAVAAFLINHRESSKQSAK